ncbi:MAG: DciA family protein [Tepidisphaeraceae bacterium]
MNLGRIHESELRRISRAKQMTFPAGKPLGPEMLAFFKDSVERRQTKFATVAQAWEVLVPATLIEHTSLEGLTRGTLSVLVDSSPHLYELKQLLLSGLQSQLLLACKSSGLRKIALKPGRWYAGSGPDRKIRFE